MSQLIPMLTCADGAAEIDFLKAAFGATQVSCRQTSDGTVIHSTLRVGDQLLMVHGEVPHLASRAPHPDGSSSVVIYLYVASVDSTIEQAVAAGAAIILPAADQPWGDRVGRIIDPSGHVWNIASSGNVTAL